MDSPAARTASLRLRAIALGTTLAVFLAGCGGGNSSSSGTAQATDAPSESATPEASAYPSGHHRHRHRKHRSSQGDDSYASSSPDANDSNDADTSDNAAANTASQAQTANGSWPCADPAFLKDQQQFASGSLTGDQEVDVCGNVTRVLASKTTRSGLHGYFYVQVAPGNTIEIVSDLGEMNAPAWPWVKVGDYAYVQGRYYYDSDSRQGIDWTHHGTSRSWPSAGYVVIGGTQYQ